MKIEHVKFDFHGCFLGLAPAPILPLTLKEETSGPDQPTTIDFGGHFDCISLFCFSPGAQR
jgi:hypothetical protein